MTDINNCHNCKFFTPDTNKPEKGICHRYPTEHTISEAIYCGEWKQNPSLNSDTVEL